MLYCPVDGVAILTQDEATFLVKKEMAVETKQSYHIAGSAVCRNCGGTSNFSFEAQLTERAWHPVEQKVDLVKPGPPLYEVRLEPPLEEIVRELVRIGLFNSRREAILHMVREWVTERSGHLAFFTGDRE